MSIYEYDEELHERTLRKEEREEGREEERELIFNAAISHGILTKEQIEKLRSICSTESV